MDAVIDAARAAGWDEAGTVRAAGGVVTRPGPAGMVELIVVHRPGYDDWTLPKGKLDGEESPEAAALREVAEETGLRCRLGQPAGWTQYTDRKGRHKVVCYWQMTVLDGAFEPTREVDEMRWLTIAEAMDILSYDRDRLLLQTYDRPESASA